MILSSPQSKKLKKKNIYIFWNLGQGGGGVGGRCLEWTAASIYLDVYCDALFVMMCQRCWFLFFGLRYVICTCLRKWGREGSMRALSGPAILPTAHLLKTKSLWTNKDMISTQRAAMYLQVWICDGCTLSSAGTAWVKRRVKECKILEFYSEKIEPLSIANSDFNFCYIYSRGVLSLSILNLNLFFFHRYRRGANLLSI